MSNCSNCGAQLSDGSRFCNKCGTDTGRTSEGPKRFNPNRSTAERKYGPTDQTKHRESQPGPVGTTDHDDSEVKIRTLSDEEKRSRNMWLAGIITVFAVLFTVGSLLPSDEVEVDPLDKYFETPSSPNSEEGDLDETYDPNYSSVRERKSSRAYRIVRRLYRKGVIESYGAEKPERGWTIQYSLDGGDAHIRTRTRKVDGYVNNEIEYEAAASYSSKPRKLMRAIEREAKRMGYND